MFLGQGGPVFHYYKEGCQGGKRQIEERTDIYYINYTE